MCEIKNILFVCMGNICRSPLAEGVFVSMLEQRGLADRFTVDSCGTGGWHTGEQADHRARAVAEKHGITLTSTARQINPSDDFDRFDLIVVMDQDNYANVLHLGCDESRLRMMRSFDKSLRSNGTHAADVPDPYYGGADGFEQMYMMLARACEGLLDELVGN